MCASNCQLLKVCHYHHHPHLPLHIFIYSVIAFFFCLSVSFLLSNRITPLTHSSHSLSPSLPLTHRSHSLSQTLSHPLQPSNYSRILSFWTSMANTSSKGCVDTPSRHPCTHTYVQKHPPTYPCPSLAQRSCFCRKRQVWKIPHRTGLLTRTRTHAGILPYPCPSVAQRLSYRSANTCIHNTSYTLILL